MSLKPVLWRIITSALPWLANLSVFQSFKDVPFSKDLQKAFWIEKTRSKRALTNTFIVKREFQSGMILHQIRFYRELKLIKVKHEGRIRRCGNSSTCATVFKHHLSHQILYRAQINKSQTWMSEPRVWKLFILKQDLCLVYDLQIYR